MSQLKIENVPDDVLEILEIRAASNERSVEAEALASIERDLALNRHHPLDVLKRLERLHGASPSLRVDHAMVDAAKRWGRE